jgi:hypothetical protein
MNLAQCDTSTFSSFSKSTSIRGTAMNEDTLVNEYVSGLKDADLAFLRSRFEKNSSDDVAEITDFVAKTPEIDQWLSAAKGPFDLLDRLEVIGTTVTKEVKKRSRQ